MTPLEGLNADFARARPDAFVRALSQFELREAIDVIGRLPPELAPSVVARLPSGHVQALIDSDLTRTDGWLTACPFNDAAAILSRLPKERRLTLINSIKDRQRRHQLLRQQRYPTHSVGSMVRDVAVRLSSETPVAEVRNLLSGIDGDSGPTVIVDGNGNYLGNVDFQALASRARPEAQIGDFAVRAKLVLAEIPISVAAAQCQLSELNWLPVVDHQGQYLGSVSRTDLLRAAGAGLTGGTSSQPLVLRFIGDAVGTLGALIDTALGGRMRG